MPQKNHEQAASHHEDAAKHHRKAAKHASEGNHEKSAYHAQLAQGHHNRATEHANEAAKKHADNARNRMGKQGDEDEMENEGSSKSGNRQPGKS
jgi:hypothetical protein